MNTLNRLCLAPVDTMTSAAPYAVPCTRLSSAAIASRNTGSPATSVYFETPASRPRRAASLM
jgi:hypothetical protein